MKDSKKREIFLDNWRDEMEAVMLYSQMAEQESDPKKKSIYNKLSQIEKKHAKIWERELRKLGVKPTFKPRWKALVLSFLGRMLGHDSMRDLLERGEGDAVEAYTKQSIEIGDKNLQKDFASIIPDEKSHSKVLQDLSGKPSEPMSGERWHQGGNSIRDLIFGMNDGLLSTFSLVAGVAGGVANNSIVILAGLAGAVAGAISMAAGAYVSTKSEKQVFEKHLEMEKTELEMMPEAEEQELALMYELKGIDPKRAKKIAKKIMSNSNVALETMAREELGIDPEELGDPLRAGIISGISFTVGASVPVVPWLILPGVLALYVSIALSLGGFFVIGAGRTLVTGKNPWKSGFEMFLIGTIAAIITYWIGSIMGVAV